MTLRPLKWTLLAASIPVFLTGCATSDLDRLTSAKVTEAQIANVEAMIAEARRVPDYPADCRKLERSGVRPGDRLDVAVLKGDQAIGRGNARAQRCAAWYDALRKARGM
jgi:hypothetical protein